jgi:hypothetical protein
MRHEHAGGHAGGRAAHAVAEVDIRNAYDGSEYAGLESILRGLRALLALSRGRITWYASLESILRGLRGVSGVHLDRTRGVAHVTYDPAVTDAGQPIEPAVLGSFDKRQKLYNYYKGNFVDQDFQSSKCPES